MADASRYLFDEVVINDVPLDVTYDYFPACRGKRVKGMQVEPDEPATVEITGIKINGIDVEGLLDDEQSEQIETILLSNMNI